MIYTLKNGKTLTIRPVSTNDAQQLINLMIQLDQETEFLARNIGEFDMTLEQETLFLERQIQDKLHPFLVAEIDDKIVGSCSCNAIRRRQRFLHRAEMGITVIKDFWGLGIGTLLMQELLHIAKEIGYEQMELDVVATNERAIALYKKMGFVQTGTTPNALKYLDGRYVDELRMVKFLK